MTETNLFAAYWSKHELFTNGLILLHLVGALLLGLLVGYERSYHGRAAGMRTYGLVCMASAALTIVSGYPEFWYGGGTGAIAPVDPTRVMQGVVTGIGFLGAGVIMREGFTISGLTTAASIWSSSVIGILVGAFAGYYGGWVDNVLMRITEAFQTLPNFVLLLVLVAVFGSTLTTVTIAVGVVSWPAPARLTRAEFLSLRNREFVQAGKTLGMKDLQLILGEILPNALPPVIVYASVVMAVSILLESALAFLRLSDPNVASWGNLIGLGRDVLRVQWYVSAIPGIAILVTVLAVSLVGQGLNDALNPRLKSR